MSSASEELANYYYYINTGLRAFYSMSLLPKVSVWRGVIGTVIQKDRWIRVEPMDDFYHTKKYVICGSDWCCDQPFPLETGPDYTERQALDHVKFFIKKAEEASTLGLKFRYSYLPQKPYQPEKKEDTMTVPDVEHKDDVQQGV